MQVVITAPGTYSIVSGASPEPGAVYNLEDAAKGSSAQGRAFHALMQEYFRTGLHSYPAKSFTEFRDYIKRDLGAGFESFVYASTEGVKKVATREEIPPEYNNKKYAMGRLKSYADYTKKERRESLDRLIAEMIEAGVNSPKFAEIMQGMGQ